MRRPLCYFAVALIIVIYAYYKIIPASVMDIPQDGSSDMFQGIVYSKEYQNENLIVYLKNVKSLSDPQKSYKGIMLYMKDEAEPKLYSTVQVKGVVRSFNCADNPGEFDEKKYYELLNISFSVRDASIIKSGKKYSKYRESMYLLKRKAEMVYDMTLSENDSSVLKAIVLGNKKQMNKEHKRLYRMNGISHVMAISGMHITILGLGVYTFLKKIKCPKIICIILSLSTIVAYADMIGMSGSAFRAIIMFGLKLSADYLGRKFDALSALAIACITILLEQPKYIFHAGFLLSFTAIIGANLFPKYLRVRGKKGKAFKYKYVYNPLILNFSIFLIQLPIILTFFYEYPLIAFATNVIIIPLIPALFTLGIIMLPFAFSDFILGLMPWLIHCMVFWIEKLCSFTLRIPGQIWIAGRPNIVCIVAYYVFIFGVYMLIKKCRKNKREIPVRITSIIIILAIVLLNTKINPPLEINYLCVGQGNSAVISDNRGHHYIIDCGSVSKSKVGEYTLIPFLKYKGIGKIDGIFITHLDEDHMNGVIELLTQISGIQIKNIYLPAAAIKDEKLYSLLKLCEEKGVPVKKLSYGNDIRSGNLEFNIYHPTQDFKAMDNNEYSFVIGLRTGDFNALFPGDIPEEIEKKVIERVGKNEKYDILLASHHGSKYSNSNQFLERINPKLTIISCGKNNSYGHPHREAVERIEASGSRIYITHEKGMITIKSNGKKHLLSTFH